MFVVTVAAFIFGNVVPPDINVFVVSKVPLLFVSTRAFVAVVTPTVSVRFCPRPFVPRAAVIVSPT